MNSSTRKYKAVLFVLITSCLVVGAQTPIFASTLFQDDFESYPLNNWPSAGWTGYGGNDGNHSVNRIELDPTDSSNQVFRLTGVVGGFWGAGAVSDVDFTDRFRANFRIYNGNETIPSSGHRSRADIGMRNGHHWNGATNPSRGFLRFDKNGNIYAGTDILQTYQTQRWYDVSVEYNRVSNSQVDLRYWIDNVDRGTYSFPIDNLSTELSLDHIELEVGAGSVYYDDVRVNSLSTGNDLPPPTREDPPPVPSGDKNLVMYTNGWNTSQSDWDNGGIWDDMGDALRDTVDGNEWQVYGHDWASQSGNLVSGPGIALNTARVQGSALGKSIADKGYDHVHLIAHSAGSNLISTAAAIIREDSPQTEIHLTFLDPYAPGTYYVQQYGANSDWAESYIADDWTLFTQPRLSLAHNVDVSAFGNTHRGPVQFYIDTIDSPNDPALEGYGFQRSREAVPSGWSTSTPSNYPLGNDFEVISPNVFFATSPGLSSATTIIEDGVIYRTDDVLDVENLSHAKSDEVQVSSTSIDMLTASPAWISMLLDVLEPVNFFEFDVEFLSEVGAEGLLAMYWDGEIVSSIDERYELSGSQNYTMWLPGIMEPGTYELAFRLDPYTGVQSRAMIDNIQTGLVAPIPEPSTFALLTLSIIAFLPRGVRKRSGGR